MERKAVKKSLNIFCDVPEICCNLHCFTTPEFLLSYLVKFQENPPAVLPLPANVGNQ